MAFKDLKTILITSREPEYQGKGDSYRSYQLKTLFGYAFYKTIAICKDVKHTADYYITPPKFSIPFTLLHSLFSKYMLQSSLFLNHRIINKINKIIDNEKPDIIVIMLARLGPLALELKQRYKNKIKIIVDFIDNYFDNYISLASISNGIKKKLYLSEANRALNIQHDVISSVDLSFFITDRDAQLYSDNKNVQVIPFIIQSPVLNVLQNQFNSSRPISNKLELVFSGNMSYLPNKLAFKYIINTLSKYLKNVRLSFIGRGITNKMIDDINVSSQDSDIKMFMVGEVVDMQKVLSMYDVAICPISVGSGVQIKILEQVASNVLVVASSFSVAGTQFEKDKEILVANTPDEYNQMIHNIQMHAVDVNMIKMHALNKLRSYYSYASVKNKFDLAIKTLIVDF